MEIETNDFVPTYQVISTSHCPLFKDTYNLITKYRWSANVCKISHLDELLYMTHKVMVTQNVMILQSCMSSFCVNVILPANRLTAES